MTVVMVVVVAVVESSVSIASSSSSSWGNLWILPDDGLRWIKSGRGECWSMSSSEGKFSSSSFSPLAAVAVIVGVGEEEWKGSVVCGELDWLLLAGSRIAGSSGKSSS